MIFSLPTEAGANAHIWGMSALFAGFGSSRRSDADLSVQRRTIEKVYSDLNLKREDH